MSRIIRWVLYFSVIVSPLPPIVYGDIQISVLRESMKVLLILLAISLLFDWKKNLRRLPAGRGNFFSLGFMAVWSVFAVISLLWSPDFSNGFRKLTFILSGTFFAFLLSMYCTRKKDFPLLFRCMLIFVIMESLIGWYEVIFRNYHYLYSAADAAFYSTSSQRVPIAIAGNPNNFALLMLFGFFIAYICFRCRCARWEGVVSILTMVSCVLLLLMTQSRAGLLGFALAAGVFVVIVLKPKPKYLIAIGGAAVIVALLIPSIRNNILSLFEFNFHTENLNSNSARVNLLLNGFYFLFRTFGLGTGIGGVEYWMANYSLFPTAGVINIHNWWMELLTEFGILFFVVYAIFYGKLFLDFYHGLRRSSDPIVQAMATGLICCMAGFLIGAVGPSSIIPIEWPWMFWAGAIAFQGYITPLTQKAKHAPSWASKLSEKLRDVTSKIGK